LYYNFRFYEIHHSEFDGDLGTGYLPGRFEEGEASKPGQ
jgi:hypothetical protein